MNGPTPLSRILQALRERGREPRLSGQDWMCRCPAHDDDTPSLSIREESPGGRIFVKCFAGCHDTAVLKKLDLTVKHLFPEKATPPGFSVRAGLKLEELATAKKLPVGFLQSLGVQTSWVRKTRSEPERSVVEALSDPGDWQNLPYKSQWREVFIPYHLPDGSRAERHRRRYTLSGEMKFAWTGTKNDGAIVPYGLDRLKIAREKGFLILVEGETDCWSLWLHGYPALGVPGATNIKTLKREYFEGIDKVFLIQEPDSGGDTFFAAIGKRLSAWKSWTGQLHRIRLDKVKDASELHVSQPKSFVQKMDTAMDQAQTVALQTQASPHCGNTSFSASPSSSSCPYTLGSTDPATNKLILSTQRTLPTAKAYTQQFHNHPDGLTLCHYAGMLFEWRGSHYRELESSTMRHRLLPWLHAALRPQYNPRSGAWELEDFPANPRTVHAALESLQAYTHLPADTTYPCWLTNDNNKPSASEILPCKSGLLHLPTLKIYEQTPVFFSLNGLDYDPDPEAEPPALWLSFLKQLFGDDNESIELLQDWFAYCLTGDTSQQKMLLLIGPKRCGKGTIARVLARLIGTSNVTGPTTSSLATDFGLQPLLGKSLAIVSDARFAGGNIQTVIERLLCISGEDTLTIDRKHKTSVTLKLPTRFIFLTNELPRLADASGALAGRFMVLRFSESFYGKEDKDLTNKLCQELPGILNWAIEGWKRLHERGHFVQPKSVSEIVDDMESLGSPAVAFIRDCCELGPAKRIEVDVIYQAWRLWCVEEGRAVAGTKQRFGRDLMAANANIRVRKNNRTGRFYEGISLNPKWLLLMSGDDDQSANGNQDKSPAEMSYSENDPDKHENDPRDKEKITASEGNLTENCPKSAAKCRVGAAQVPHRNEDFSQDNSLQNNTLENECRVVPHRTLLHCTHAQTRAQALRARGKELICSGKLCGTTRHLEIKPCDDSGLHGIAYAAPAEFYAAPARHHASSGSEQPISSKTTPEASGNHAETSDPSLTTSNNDPSNEATAKPPPDPDEPFFERIEF